MADTTEKPVDKWLKIVSQYDNEFKKWNARVPKILRRYRDDTRTEAQTETAKFNILWANVQTLIGAVFARLPKADVSRRFSDTDPIGRVAALLIERCLDYEIEHYSDYRSAMQNSVSDRFLGGRGVSWVRYDPHTKPQLDEEGEQITEDVQDPDDQTNGDEAEPAEEIDYECSPTDYVHWKDFGHSIARTWEEVEQVWRIVYMTDEAGLKRFGKEWKGVPLDSGPDPLNRYGIKDSQNTRAKIYELWDKAQGKAVWFSKAAGKILDERADPLELEGFFPTPKPLYATLTSDNLVPVPDFTLYQDQANELDTLADRIDGLVKALKVRGVYDSSVPALQRLFTEAGNNDLIPVDKWGAFAEKGGLKGTLDLVPLDMIANALLMARQAMDQIKGQVYEITGISDIIRGDTAASETATAQDIKSKYAGLRLKTMQDGVAIFASELLRIKAQIICSKYQDSTILAYSAADQLSDADKQYLPQAMQLLRQNPLRSFRIEVAADSLVMLDENQVKQDRVEFLKAFGTFFQQAEPVAEKVPEMVPAMVGMMQYAISGFKAARTLEGTLDAALEQLKQKAANQAANPQPPKEAIQAQADMAAVQAKLQGDQAVAQIKSQADGQIAQMREQAINQRELAKAAHEAQMRQMEMQHESQMAQTQQEAEDTYKRWESELKAATSLAVAEINASKALAGQDAAASGEAKVEEDLGEAKPDPVSEMMRMHSEAMDKIAEVMQAVRAPKKVIRGADGRVTGVTTETVQ